jgi:lyso-ornithine lipid O-acyltransferase
MKIIKLLGFIILIINYIAICSLTNFVLRKKKLSASVTSFFSFMFLKLLNLKVIVNGTFRNEDLVISNHLSYLDILIISSVCRSIFITSKEIEKDLFLGLLSKLNNSIFVERRSKTTLIEDNKKIISLLDQKIPLVLFPEGTSSDGKNILPFKSSLFYCVQARTIHIKPICIKYLKINDKEITDEDRNIIFYYGDAKFFPHLMKIFTLKSIDIEINFLNEIESNSRKEVCHQTFQQIKECYDK